MLKDMDPGTWDSSSSGHVDSGEDYHEAAIRELHEELGVRCDEKLHFLIALDACPETGMEFVKVYRLEHEGPFELHPEEIDDAGWYSIEEIHQWIQERPDEISPSFRHIWRHLQDQGTLPNNS